MQSSKKLLILFSLMIPGNANISLYALNLKLNLTFYLMQIATFDRRDLLSSGFFCYCFPSKWEKCQVTVFGILCAINSFPFTNIFNFVTIESMDHGISFFTAVSWEKDTIFGAAQTNFRPFLFWQGFSVDMNT